MNILYFCPRWGSEDISWEDFFLKVRDAGYDGVEWAIGNHVSLTAYDTVFALSSKLHMPVIAQHYETADAKFSVHYDNYENWWKKIRHYPALKINSQTGKDYFSFEENKQFIALAGEYAKAMNIPVVHETHRGKFSFAAHVTKRYLQLIPDLRITFDASHWVNVAESLLDDQQEAMTLAISRTDHIHARIGFAEGPQVHDPRTEYFQDAMAAHYGWWDEVVQCKSEASEDLTISPEFGPWPYMVHHPVSREPLASQWDINLFMLSSLKARYATNKIII